MYTCHLGVYRRERVVQLEGFRTGFEGAQDYDLVLRLMAVSHRIYHIPKVLYHWRKSDSSCAGDPSSKGYAFDAGLRALKEALQRQGQGAMVQPVACIPGCYLVRYPVQGKPLVSILIPTRDQPQLLDRCLTSILCRSHPVDYEILIVDNQSRNSDTHDAFNRWRQVFGNRLRLLPMDVPFNYSRINNAAASQARGQLLVLLNDDTEILSSGWLAEMAGYAQRPDIGAVGALLLYPDHSIQHAGIVLGITGTPGTPGVAGHSHKYLSAESSGYFGRLKIVANYSAVTGACMMVKKQLFHAVGGLDEQLSVAFNDVDFCLKLLHKGYRHVVLPHVRLIHHESKSRGHEDDIEKQRRFAGEILSMQNRWKERLAADVFYNPNLTLWRENFDIKSEEERHS
jgi:GT2 family glycosyltransferase